MTAYCKGVRSSAARGSAIAVVETWKSRRANAIRTRRTGGTARSNCTNGGFGDSGFLERSGLSEWSDMLKSLMLNYLIVKYMTNMPPLSTVEGQKIGGH